MSELVTLRHVSRYQYDRAVSLGPQTVRLRPALHCRVPIRHYALTVAPANHAIHWYQDPIGNWLARLLFPEKTSEFIVTVELVAAPARFNPFDFLIEPYAETVPFAYPADFAAQLAPYLTPEPVGPRLGAWLATLPRAVSDTTGFLVALNHRLHREIRYLLRAEAGVRSPEETLAAAAGACRDTAWLLVQALRHLGFGARFVSGYLLDRPEELAPFAPPDVSAAGFEAGAEPHHLHAWAEVYVPGAGWIGLDPTSGLLCADSHIPLAAVPHYRSAAPISGALERAHATFSFDISIARAGEGSAGQMQFASMGI